MMSSLSTDEITQENQYVYENKQISDKMPGKKSDIYVLDSDICG